MISIVRNYVEYIARLLAQLAGLALIAAGITILAEVFMRQIGLPLIGTDEIAKVLFAYSVFFSFPYIVMLGREIRVDFIYDRLGLLSRRIADALSKLLTVAFFALFAWLSWKSLSGAWFRDIFMAGRLGIPMWITWFAVVIGTFSAGLAASLLLFAALRGERPDHRDLITEATVE
ncbi:TRAP transporter small permease [Chelativorans sp. Marseille-P2723]|uniref:TRAP transporter small permease n=1 Tax=Chelativorans sp. Marseille-P2723 TaxID=2709133 RepID=UPI00156E81FB|nr:TRAP transporter small permease [Chelativorans sp. Marseille-P2723]